MEDKTNSPEEILDLVDENDNVIGKVKKFEANQNPKFIHREVGIIIFDDRRRVLLAQRSFLKKVSPGLWSISCAGHVQVGFSYQETAHRELQEELGFDTNLKFLEKVFNQTPTESRFFAWFLGCLSVGTVVRIEKSEVDQVRFYTKSEFEEFSSEIISDPRYQFVRKGILMVDRFFAGEWDKLL